MLTVYTALSLGVITIVLWIGLLSREEGWIKKACLFYTIDANLLEVTVSEGVAQKLFAGAVGLSPGSTKVLRDLVHGKSDLQNFKEYMCGLPDLAAFGLKPLCGIWTSVQWSSWGLCFAVGMGSTCLAVATGCLYWYAFVSARSNVRMWYLTLHGAASMFYVFGMAQYFWFSASLHDMPPSSPESPHGPCCMFGAFLCILSLIPLFLVGMMGETYDEKINEALSAGKKDLRDFRKDVERDETAMLRNEMNYGAMDGAQAQAPQPLGGFPVPAPGIGYGVQAPVYGVAADGYVPAASGYGAVPEDPNFQGLGPGSAFA